jgi:HEAT repeat protein
MNHLIPSLALSAVVWLLPLYVASAAEVNSVEELIQELKFGDDAGRREASYRLSQLGAGASDAVPALIEALDDKETQVWFNSITALARIGPAAEAAIPALKEQLVNARGGRYSQQMWYRASFALGSIGKASLPTLSELLDHRDAQVRSGAAKAATWMSADAVSLSGQLAENLADDDEEVRRYSAEALASFGESSITLLEKALQQDNRGARMAAAHGLELLQPMPQGSASKVAAALADEPDVDVRRQFLHTLSRLDYEADEFLPVLVSHLDSGNEGVRQEVANALILMDDPENTSVPALTELLGDTDSNKVSVAVELLAAIGPDAGSAVDELIALRPTLSVEVQRSLDQSLIQIGEAAVPDLVQVMNEHAGVSDHWSVVCLREIGGRAVPSLIASLRSDDLEKRRNAVTMLGYLGTAAEPAIPQLAELLRNGPESLRDAALRALGTAGAPADLVVPPAQLALQSEMTDRRRSGAMALAALGNDSRAALPDLIAALGDSDNVVKINAARAIGSIQPPVQASVSPLMDALKSTEVSVQVEVVRALGKMGETSQPAIPAVVELLSNASPELQTVISTALGELGSTARSALPEIKKQLAGGSPATRVAALKAYARIENDADRKVELLTTGLDDEDLSVRLVALAELGELGRAAAPAAEKVYALTEREAEREIAFGVLAGMRLRNVPLLVRALGNPDPYVREYVAGRLGDLRSDSREAVPALRKLLETETDDRVRRAVRGALREIERDN